MSVVNKQIFAKANAAILKRDLEGFLLWCTEDTTWAFEGDRTIEGKEAVLEWMRATYVEPPDFNVHSMIADDEYVVALGDIR